jgi:hypothetical protein
LLGYRYETALTESPVSVSLPWLRPNVRFEVLVSAQLLVEPDGGGGGGGGGDGSGATDNNISTPAPPAPQPPAPAPEDSRVEFYTPLPAVHAALCREVGAELAELLLDANRVSETSWFELLGNEARCAALGVDGPKRALLAEALAKRGFVSDAELATLATARQALEAEAAALVRAHCTSLNLETSSGFGGSSGSSGSSGGSAGPPSWRVGDPVKLLPRSAAPPPTPPLPLASAGQAPVLPSLRRQLSGEGGAWGVVVGRAEASGAIEVGERARCAVFSAPPSTRQRFGALTRACACLALFFPLYLLARASNNVSAARNLCLVALGSCLCACLYLCRRTPCTSARGRFGWTAAAHSPRAGRLNSKPRRWTCF